MRSLMWLAAIWLMAQPAQPAQSAQSAQAPEVDITGYYTQDGMKDGEFVRITRNGEVYQMLQRYQDRQDLRNKIPALVNDCLLALTARSLGATLYTRNRDDFALIQKVRTFSLVVVG